MSAGSLSLQVLELLNSVASETCEPPTWDASWQWPNDKVAMKTTVPYSDGYKDSVYNSCLQSLPDNRYWGPFWKMLPRGPRAERQAWEDAMDECYEIDNTHVMTAAEIEETVDVCLSGESEKIGVTIDAMSSLAEMGANGAAQLAALGDAELIESWKRFETFLASAGGLGVATIEAAKASQMQFYLQSSQVERVEAAKDSAAQAAAIAEGQMSLEKSQKVHANILALLDASSELGFNLRDGDLEFDQKRREQLERLSQKKRDDLEVQFLKARVETLLLLAGSADLVFDAESRNKFMTLRRSLIAAEVADESNAKRLGEEVAGIAIVLQAQGAIEPKPNRSVESFVLRSTLTRLRSQWAADVFDGIGLSLDPQPLETVKPWELPTDLGFLRRRSSPSGPSVTDWTFISEIENFVFVREGDDRRSFWDKFIFQFNEFWAALFS